MQFPCTFALLLASATWSLAAPVEGKRPGLPSHKLIIAGKTLSHPALNALQERDVPSNVEVCVEQWSKDHNAASLAECIKAALLDQAFVF